MYDFLRGRLIESHPGRLVLDVNGVGFEVSIPISDNDAVGKGAEALIWTHLVLRDDSLRIFGFFRKAERDLFRLLIKVTGIGPRLAMQVLSGIRPDELIRAMMDDDWKRLTLIQGIGPKTARRLLIEMKEKLTDQELLIPPSGGAPTDPILSQAFSALTNLGFPPDAIRKVLREIAPSGGEDAGAPQKTDLETLIKEALTRLTK